MTTTSRPTASATPTATITPASVGLLDIRSIVPDAIIDLRYATTNNFTHVRLYPVDAHCYVHESMAAGLKAAADQLRRWGYRIVFWDCYRPHYVQVHMFEIVPDENWVARPGPYARSHEAGRSVDITLAYRDPAYVCSAAQKVQHRCLVDMGTDFDDFTDHAHAYATSGVTATQQRNRATLRNGMAAGHITVYSGEWWHFDGPGADDPRPHLYAPLD